MICRLPPGTPTSPPGKKPRFPHPFSQRPLLFILRTEAALFFISPFSSRLRGLAQSSVLKEFMAWYVNFRWLCYGVRHKQPEGPAHRLETKGVPPYAARQRPIHWPSS